MIGHDELAGYPGEKGGLDAREARRAERERELQEWEERRLEALHERALRDDRARENLRPPK